MRPGLVRQPSRTRNACESTKSKRHPKMSPSIVPANMIEEAKQLAAESSQRVQVQMERHPQGKRVKIRVESYDAGLGWYTAGCVTVPLHQLPLVEQAIEDMRHLSTDDEFADIIPFPGMTNTPAA
jgi:hypothetical protein